MMMIPVNNSNGNFFFLELYKNIHKKKLTFQHNHTKKKVNKETMSVKLTFQNSARDAEHGPGTKYLTTAVSTNNTLDFSKV